MSVGLRRAGFRILAGVDNSPIALQTFARNHPEATAIEADLAQLKPDELMDRLKLRPEKLDCLVGGPPCQGFSKNVPRRARFSGDPRNLLVWRFLDFVRELRPRVVVMENVAEIVKGYDGSYTEEVLKFFEKLKYKAGVRVLYAPDFGVPQRRRRAFFFANRTGVRVEFPTPTHRDSGEPSLFNEPAYVSVWDAIGDLPRLQHGQGESPCEYGRDPLTEYQTECRDGTSQLYDHVARRLRDRQLQRLQSIGPGEAAKDLPKELKPKSHYSGAYGKLEPGSLAPTITRWVFHPGSGRFGHPKDDRVITIREAARLQSFPDSFVFEGTYIQKSHQVGNAVPPLLLQAFGPLVRKAVAL